ncbi:MAG TPA: winged helix-turn-helix domain-containing protein [Pyrinomonadaceae bacterium]|nr:winged helix-turn-helix domain-containing protein [Pyrinomonadaceae bacterium]
MKQEEHDFYEFGPFRLDATEGVLMLRGEHVHLTPKALKLLLILVRHGNHILDKDELMRQVWPDTVVEETNLAGNIHALRQILGEGNDEERYIETIPKRGYRFVAKVRQVRGEGINLVTQESTAVNIVIGDEEVKKSEVSKALDAAIVSGARLQRRKGLILKLLAVVVTVCGLTGAAIYFWVWGKTKPADHALQITSIAVLPLKNLSGDAAQEYFADGMTEAMINELAKIGGLRVISRQSIMQYKGAPKRTPDIARELNVDAVVEGSVLRSDNRVRITAQLIRAATDEHMWAESYERDLSNVLALQREIARGIAGEIRIKLTPQEQERLTSPHPINPAAHDAYLKGLYYLNQAIDEPHTEEFERLSKRSFEYFEQAIKFDPDYALAYSALAVSYHFMASEGFPLYPKAKEAALKALALDDSLAGAHAALAFIIWRLEWDFEGAEREFKKAEELAPNLDNWGYAQFLSTLGRHDEAIRRFRLALDIDPLTLLLKINVGYSYFLARQYDQAIAQFRTVLELDPKQFDAQSALGTTYVLKGMHEEGIAECQRALELSGETAERANLAWAYAMAGKRSQAIKLLDDLKDPSKQESVSHVMLATIYSALGEKDLGMAYLEKAHAKRQDELLWLKVSPELDGLRSDPRFTDLLRRIGFPE